MAQSPKERTVLFDHDGGYDDLLSLLMLLAMPHITIAGIVVTPADCFLRPAVSASLKILRFFDRTDIELSEGTLHGVNPFPRAWRQHAYAVDALPILNELKGVETSQQQADRDIEAGIPRPGITYRMPPLVPNSFDALKKRIQDKIIAKLDPTLDLSRTDEVRRIIQDMFEQSLQQENIVLSRSEWTRLFEAISEDILSKSANILPTPVSKPGHEFLARKLREASEPLTVLITGPVSNLAAALVAEPDLATKIEEVIWMGGALQVDGNVRDYEHDGSTEWNAYWDPPATHQLWQSQAPLTLFSLDATNKVPVRMEFLHRLAQQRRYPLSDLAGQIWAMTVGTIPGHEYTYHMWDTLTTGYLGAPEFITLRAAHTEAIPTGPSAGRIKEVTEGGRAIQVADNVDVAGFFNYILALLRR